MSRRPSRSRSAIARVVTPVAALSMVKAVHVPVGVQGVDVQGFLYQVMVLLALAAWTTSRKPSPSMSASQMSLELLGQPVAGVAQAARLASVKGVQVGGSPPPLMYPRICGLAFVFASGPLYAVPQPATMSGM